MPSTRSTEVMADSVIPPTETPEIPDKLYFRIGDVSKRIDDMRDLLRAEMAKNQSEMLHRFADLDSRLTRIDGHLNLK